MVWVVNVTGDPPRVIPARTPTEDVVGSIACRPLAPAPTAIVKLSVLPDHASDPNDDPFRPSSHVSSCFADTTGTPLAMAALTMVCWPGWLALSVCMFAVTTP